MAGLQSLSSSRIERHTVPDGYTLGWKRGGSNLPEHTNKKTLSVWHHRVELKKTNTHTREQACTIWTKSTRVGQLPASKAIWPPTESLTSNKVNRWGKESATHILEAMKDSHPWTTCAVWKGLPPTESGDTQFYVISFAKTQRPSTAQRLVLKLKRGASSTTTTTTTTIHKLWTVQLISNGFCWIRMITEHYPLFARDSALPVHEVHGAIRVFGWYSNKSLKRHSRKSNLTAMKLKCAVDYKARMYFKQ